MSDQNDMSAFHWMMEMIHTIDVGMVVINKEFEIQAWNGFMENHSGLQALEVKEKNLFSVIENIDEAWFRHKASTAFELKNLAFTIWEQRPYVFKFKNYRPITGTADYMYQNCTFFPVMGPTGEVESVSIIVYDVTDTAINKLELQKANAKLKHLSRTDRLTELFNRGYWEELLQKEFSRCSRTKKASSVVMFDIDHFKRVNDTYGHQAGDEVIRKTCGVLRENLRETDIAGRYGGEEFGVILVETNAQEAMVFCERLRKDIEQLKVLSNGEDITFTVSLGISEFNEDIIEYEKWLEGSDLALYQSKEKGRNQTNIYE